MKNVLFWLVGLGIIVLVILLFKGKSYSLESFSEGEVDNDSLKIMTYNVLVGLKDEVRRDSFIDFMKGEAPDVVALQELNGLSEKDLGDLAIQYGHPYVVQLKRFGYPVGITSKYPIEKVDKLRMGFHHGALHVKIEGIHYIIVHLSPLSAEKRKEEAQRLMDYLDKEEILGNQDVVILGDFNAHSIEDADYMDKIELISHYDEKNLVDGRFDFQTIGTLTNYGFVDAYSFVTGDEELKHVTYPTDNKETRGERIDFIMVSESLAPLLNQGDILMNPDTDVISDHYPVMVELKYGKD